MIAGICRSDALRAQKPVGSSSRSTGAANVSQSASSAARWTSDRTTVTAMRLLLQRSDTGT